ncbi:MAG: zinc-ribbon domain-containing protein [Spirochaetaceae bacterium]|nr:zinc-ribbon domain-containing protein [Spirochaetaceae bacterium]
MKKQPRFFCDNCGAEVPKTANSCPRCGRFFASIRCPKCGFSGGNDTAFSNGCPRCGYSSFKKPPARAAANKASKAGTALRNLPLLFVIIALFVFICSLLIMLMNR